MKIKNPLTNYINKIVDKRIAKAYEEKIYPFTKDWIQIMIAEYDEKLKSEYNINKKIY